MHNAWLAKTTSNGAAAASAALLPSLVLSALMHMTPDAAGGSGGSRSVATTPTRPAADTAQLHAASLPADSSSTREFSGQVREFSQRPNSPEARKDE